MVGPMIECVLRRKEVFGEDVDVFRPERWLEGGKERSAEMKKVVDLVFGHGRYGCAGKVEAFLELNKVFVEPLRDFDFQLAYPVRPWNSQNFSVHSQRDMWVAVSLCKQADV